MTGTELLPRKVIKSQSCLDSQPGFKLPFSDKICGFSLQLMGHIRKYHVYPLISKVYMVAGRMEVRGTG